MALGDFDGNALDDVATTDEPLSWTATTRLWYAGHDGSAPPDAELDHAPGDAIGGEATGAADVNGDGVDDLILSVYGASILDYVPYGGLVLVYPGPLSGTFHDDSIGSVLYGDGDPEVLDGHSDLTGDGLPDLVVGDSTVDGGTGSVYVVDAPLPSQATLADAPIQISGLDASIAYFSGCSAGDVDGDGADDLVTLSADVDTTLPPSGEAWVFWGPLTGTQRRGDAGAVAVAGRWAESVTVLGDFDGDGDGDLAVAAGVDVGANEAELFYDPRGTVQPDAILLQTPSTEDGALGVAAPGDIDGDGLDDLLLGAPRSGGSGRGGDRGEMLILGVRTGF